MPMAFLFSSTRLYCWEMCYIRPCYLTPAGHRIRPRQGNGHNDRETQIAASGRSWSCLPSSAPQHQPGVTYPSAALLYLLLLGQREGGHRFASSSSGLRQQCLRHLGGAACGRRRNRDGISIHFLLCGFAIAPVPNNHIGFKIFHDESNSMIHTSRRKKQHSYCIPVFSLLENAETAQGQLSSRSPGAENPTGCTSTRPSQSTLCNQLLQNAVAHC